MTTNATAASTATTTSVQPRMIQDSLPSDSAIDADPALDAHRNALRDQLLANEVRVPLYR